MNHVPTRPLAEPLRNLLRAIADLRRGAPIALTDPSGPVLLLAAETATTESLTEFASLAAGPPVLLLAPRRAAALGLPTPETPAFTACTLTGAALRPDVLRALADPTAPQPPPSLLAGAMAPAPLPLLADAAVRLAKRARLLPSILLAPAPPDLPPSDQAGPLRLAAATVPAHAADEGLHIVAEAQVPLEQARDTRIIAFRPRDGGLEHLALVVGDLTAVPAPLVRIHSACLTGDLFGSLRCDCGPQLRAALARMNTEGSGVLLYLAQEGRGIGIVNKLRAYQVQDRGQDTLDANLSLGWEVDERSFEPAAEMLRLLGLPRIRLLTNNQAKLTALAACGIEIAGREPHVIPPNGVNDAYLRAKADRLGHLLG